MRDIIESYGRGPDVLIASDGLNFNCYSDDPNRLGTVLLWEPGTSGLPQVQKLKPFQLDGYSEFWIEELSSEIDKNPNFDYKSFLVGFLERNLLKEDVVPQYTDIKMGNF